MKLKFVFIQLVSESISNYGEGESIISDVNKKALSIVTVQTEQLNLNVFFSFKK